MYYYDCFYGHCTGQRASAGTPSEGLEDVHGVKFYCPHAVAVLDWGEDATFLLSGVTCTISVPVDTTYKAHTDRMYNLRAFLM